MNARDLQQLSSWVIQSGLAGASETALLNGFCEKCHEAGLDLSRGMAIIDTLHPTYEGRAFRWRNDGVSEEAVVEYGRTPPANWQRSVFYHLLTTGEDEFRCRLDKGEIAEFHNLNDLRDQGHTDYLALVHRFASDGVIGDMDCFYSHWTTSRPEGFVASEVEALRILVPQLALAIKCASLRRIAGTLVEVYLGHDAGQRVLSGRISRGVADRISAVLWFSDLRDYTAISDTAAPDEVIPLLNDYADAVISSIHEAGGDVLKLIGDGILAIFKADDPADACRCALRAQASLQQRLKTLNARRSAEKRPVTSVYLGLHIGDVFYGNIGSENRLDFTVIGPAVNEVSRIASMCRSVDREIAMSADFVAATPPGERRHVISLGRFALRGVRRAQELFTLDPAILDG